MADKLNIHTAVYELAFPFKVVTREGEQTITQISLRRCTLGDLNKARAAHPNDLPMQELFLTCMLSKEGLVLQDLERMDAADSMALSAIFQGLFRLPEPAAQKDSADSGDAGQVAALAAQRNAGDDV